MGALGTLVVYGVLGAVVAAAMWLQDSRGRTLRAWELMLRAVFWPLFAPVLFGTDGETKHSSERHGQQRLSWRARIERAEKLLEDKLATLDGAAAARLSCETVRIRQLQHALEAMAGRVHEMDMVLASTELDETLAREAFEQRRASVRQAEDPVLESLAARLLNIQSLKQLRERNVIELERALCRMEEMSTRLSLLRFTEGEARDAAVLIDEISGTIDDITEAILAVA